MSLPSDSVTTAPLDGRIEILADELELAIEYGLPSILLAVYRSELMRAEVETALAERLQPLAQRLERVFVNKESYDLPLYLRERADAATTIYCVSGLRFGGGEDGRNAYRALNIRREYFVDDQMRVIFWLTESEDRDLPRYAPDFWAFRHRTVEFLDDPQPRHIDQYAHELTWRGWHGAEATDSPAFTEDTAAKIAYREQLLNDLPDTPERAKARANVLCALAPLYAARGEYEKAIEAYNKAIELDPKFTYPHNGLGNVYRLNGRYDEAIEAYNKAIELDPKDAGAQMSLASIYRKLGKTAVYNQQIEITRPLIANASPYNRACFASICGDVEEAIRLLKESFVIGDGDREWAQNDPDFEFIRDDPRFQSVAGA